jgi:hypothetical protein
MSRAQLDALDLWMSYQKDPPENRPDAIRRIIWHYLGVR